jgi:hypothetical protein
VTTGIFTLVGVIVGGLLTGAVDLYIERRKRQALIFMAKRLVGDDLSTIVIHLDGLIERGTAPLSDEQRRAKFMPTSAWETHRETLAQKGAVSDDDWQELSSILHAVGSLRFMILELPPASPVPAHLMSGVREQRQLVADLHLAITDGPVDI